MNTTHTNADANTHHPGNYTFSPVTVTVTGTVGVVSLGIIVLVLLRALLRALARNRQLEIQLAGQSPK